MVYPGQVDVIVHLDPGAEGCSDLTVDRTNCTAIITRDDIYTFTLTISNDVGSTTPIMKIFNRKSLSAMIYTH